MKNIWNDKKDEGLTQPGSSDAWPSKANPGTSVGADAGTASVAVKQSAGGTTKDDYWANREARDLEKERVYREEDIPAIRRSKAYEVAGHVLESAVTADALSFGSAAKGKRFDMLLAMLDLAAEHVLARMNGEEIDEGADEAPADTNEQKETDLG
jgi:hypothetical protein